MQANSIKGLMYSSFGFDKAVMKKEKSQQSKPSFGYALADKPYEKAALKFLKEQNSELSDALGREMLLVCRHKVSEVKNLTDELMDKGVLMARKLGFDGSENGKVKIPEPARFQEGFLA